MRRHATRERLVRHGARPSKEAARPIPASERLPLERAFGYSFADVRVHSGDEAARSAAAFEASAYTLGGDIFFGRHRYSPATRDGKALLAHELAHVVQQGRAPTATRGDPPIGRVSDAAERDADAAAIAAMAPAPTSLRIADWLGANCVSAPTIQRAVTTWGGEWDTTKYNLQATPGVNGVEIELSFTPNDRVDATLIGTVQTARSRDKAGPVNLGGPPAEDAVRKARTIQPPDAAAGTRLDLLPAYGNPLYAADIAGPRDTLATTKTVPDFGHHGWRYMDKGVEKKRSATLVDAPALSDSLVESSQVFEATAVAVRGAQEGTFYGSVQWGWTKDAGGVVKKLPLARVSNDAPSNVFAAATRLWNPSKTSTGAETLDLPIVFRGYARADDTPLVSDPADAAGSEIGTLKKNTRVEVTALGKKEPFNAGAKTPWWHVTVVSDAHVGKVGWMLSSALATDAVK